MAWRSSVYRNQQPLVLGVLGVLLLAGVLLAGGTFLLLHRARASADTRDTIPATSAPAPARPAPSQTITAAETAELRAVALARDQAAGWIAQQLSSAAIVACDSAMCSTLEAGGLSASRLLVLGPAAADPLGSDIVIATSTVRTQFGDRLSSVYAPLVIATFGIGPARIDIRAMAPGGAAVFAARLAADRHARVVAGNQLARNRHITVTAAARAALTAGYVDPRLLVLLASLAGRQQVDVVAFGDPSPGAADMPLRSVQIRAASPAALRLMLAFLRAQHAPYQAARTAEGHDVLSVQFDAPSPMGLANGP